MNKINSLVQWVNSWPESDLYFKLVAVLAASIAVLLFVKIARKKDNRSEGFNYLGGAAGRIDKFEVMLGELKDGLLKLKSDVDDELSSIKESIESLRNAIDSGGLEGSGAQTGKGKAEDKTFPGYVSVTDNRTPKEPLGEPERAAGGKKGEGESKSEKKTLAGRLKKTREGLLGRLAGIFSSAPILDLKSVEAIEEILIGADIGVSTASDLIEEVRAEVEKGAGVDEEGFKALLKMRLLSVLEKDAPLNNIIPERQSDGPLVVMVVGVNGAGKTTTAGKLAHQWHSRGAGVMLVAADTFRAAAVEQLEEWGERADVPVISGAENAKPSTVVYDAMVKAKEGGADVLIIDTAGRLHTKTNLMSELSGVINTIRKHQESAPHEVLLVLDGSTGQNALNQAREFNEAVPLTGLVVTKLDGTQKGGVVAAVKKELGIPVRYIGVGENTDDLREFQAMDFVDALFDVQEGQRSGTRTTGSFYAPAKGRVRGRKDTT